MLKILHFDKLAPNLLIMQELWVSGIIDYA